MLRRCGGLRAYWRASGELLARVPAAQLRPCRLPGRALLRFRHLAADPA
ncbi:MAG: hypothetical protein R3F29_00215 [Planctomycetota bacterium]